jgi:hypothetical protein
MTLMLAGLFLLLVPLIIVAVVRPEARESRLVRAGAAVLLPTFVMLTLIPSMFTGLLFYFTAPFAILAILIGTILSFVKSDRQMQQDVEKLVAASRRSNRVWPDDPRLPEIEFVTRHGGVAGPALVARLQFDSEDRLRDETWSPGVEQHLELALCRIYGETPAGARTVYDVRATAAENAKVKLVWEARVRSTAGQVVS